VTIKKHPKIEVAKMSSYKGLFVKNARRPSVNGITRTDPVSLDGMDNFIKVLPITKNKKANNSHFNQVKIANL